MLLWVTVIVMSSVPPPPPLAPINGDMPPRKNRARLIAAIIVVVLLVGGLAAYFLVLTPKMSIVDWSHANSPLPQTITDWQYTFTVTVKNSGILSGNSTIVCEFIYVNSTGVSRTFTGSLAAHLKGGQQADYTVEVPIPLADALSSILTQNKSWNVRLA